MSQDEHYAPDFVPLAELMHTNRQGQNVITIIRHLFQVYPRGVVYGAIWHMMAEFIRECPRGFRQHVLQRLHQVADEADDRYDDDNGETDSECAERLMKMH